MASCVPLRKSDTLQMPIRPSIAASPRKLPRSLIATSTNASSSRSVPLGTIFSSESSSFVPRYTSRPAEPTTAMNAVPSASGAEAATPRMSYAG
eukprot:scaffold8449_cov277-Pinguiococcus_pyrenoidosus.AAC.2